MKIIVKIVCLLGCFCFATSAMAFQYCPMGYCPAPEKVFTQSGIVQFIMPQGGTNDLYGPTPEAFNQNFSAVSYDSFPGGTNTSVMGYVNLPGCQCNYTFIGTETMGASVGQVSIHYVSPKAGSLEMTK